MVVPWPEWQITRRQMRMKICLSGRRPAVWRWSKGKDPDNSMLELGVCHYGDVTPKSPQCPHNPVIPQDLWMHMVAGVQNVVSDIQINLPGFGDMPRNRSSSGSRDEDNGKIKVGLKVLVMEPKYDHSVLLA